MADISQSDISQVAGTQYQRVHLHRVMIDTTALLNMVKHCREADWRAGG